MSEEYRRILTGVVADVPSYGEPREYEFYSEMRGCKFFENAVRIFPGKCVYNLTRWFHNNGKRLRTIFDKMSPETVEMHREGMELTGWDGFSHPPKVEVAELWSTDPAEVIRRHQWVVENDLELPGPQLFYANKGLWSMLYPAYEGF